MCSEWLQLFGPLPGSWGVGSVRATWPGPRTLQSPPRGHLPWDAHAPHIARLCLYPPRFRGLEMQASPESPGVHFKGKFLGTVPGVVRLHLRMWVINPRWPSGSCSSLVICHVWRRAVSPASRLPESLSAVSRVPAATVHPPWGLAPGDYVSERHLTTRPEHLGPPGWEPLAPLAGCRARCVLHVRSQPARARK